jgi:hypothetical protein
MRSKAEIVEQLSEETRKLGIGKLPKFFQSRFVNALVVMYEAGIMECLKEIEGTDAWYHLKEEYEKKWPQFGVPPAGKKEN